MGEAGVVVPPDGYLVAAGEITARHGALLVIDEVQTGMGRTGNFFAHQDDGIVADVVTMAKGLGGVLPIGACLAVGPVPALLHLACTAALSAAIRSVRRRWQCCVRLADQGLVKRSGALGKSLSQGIESLNHPLVDHVRDRGLLPGVVLSAKVARRVEAIAREAGFLVNAAAPGVIRLAPPLVITEAQIDLFVKSLPDVLDNAEV